MAKGASSRSGPAPDPNALRRDRDGDTWVTLPAEGRKGRAPKWPLAKQTAREKTLWAAEWKRPQAVEWERNGLQLEVAIYVRSVISAEALDAPANKRNLVRQQMEALGISLPGLARNHWKIEGLAPTAATKSTPVRSKAKDRFKVIEGGG